MQFPSFAHVVRAVLMGVLAVGAMADRGQAAIYNAAVGANWQLADLQVNGGDVTDVLVFGAVGSAASKDTHGNAHADYLVNDTVFQPLTLGDSLLLSPAAWGEAMLPSRSLGRSSAVVIGTMSLFNLSNSARTITLGFNLIPEAASLVEATASVDDVLVEESMAEAAIRFVDALGQETTLLAVAADGVSGPFSASAGDTPQYWQTEVTLDPGANASVQVITEARGEAFVNPEPGAVVIWSVLGFVGLGITQVRRRRCK